MSCFLYLSKLEHPMHDHVLIPNLVVLKNENIIVNNKTVIVVST